MPSSWTYYRDSSPRWVTSVDDEAIPAEWWGICCPWEPSVRMSDELIGKIVQKRLEQRAREKQQQEKGGDRTMPTMTVPKQPALTPELAQFQTQLDELFRDMTDLLVRKRKSYGTTALTKFGMMGVLIRASDKIDRLTTMVNNGTTQTADNESMADAWRDLIGYSALALLMMDEGASK